MPLPASHPHPRYGVSGYREDEVDGRMSWSCELLRHGQGFGLVGGEDDGPHRYTFTDEARGEEFLAAARALHPDAAAPADVLVDELLTVRQMNALDQVAYCFDEDRFEESGEHRVADPGLTFEQVRELLATRYAAHHPRVWDRTRSAMVPVAPAD
ncbi:hypothetical protein GCM10027586_21620 [Kineococcus gypseus]|uniref:hypothetical protein n=1 Tax=Kineococcus gypseus TaxID=1637102 RepID=UPI003D7D26FB